MTDQPVRRRLAAILAADVAGYTRLVEQDTDGTVAAWKAARDDVIKPLVDGKSGRIIKFTGDGFLVEFPSVQDAVACAIALQEGLASSSLKFRMGINVGDITDDGGDVHGEGVNIAARLEALAEPGGICISGDVHNQVRNRIDIAFKDMGEKEVKHVSLPVKVFAIQLAEPTSPTKPEAAVSEKNSIAVLPFDNMSNDPEQAYFSDGITEDIITDLSKISSLFVIARNTSFTYKGRAVDVSQVARELGVKYILEGSVRKSGNRVRINAQLIEGLSGGHIWADRFDRELADIFAVQDEVTGNIVEALHLHLTPQEQGLVGAKGPSNIEAYDLILRARELLYRFTAEATAEARQLLDESIRLAPDYSDAYSNIALALFNEYLSGWNGATRNNLDEALQMALKAVELNPNDAHAHWALGATCLWTKDFERSEFEINKSIELDPNYCEGYATRGYLLSFVGRPDDAIRDIDHAMRLNPEYPKIFLHFLAQAYFLKGNYEQAAELLQRRIRLNPETDISRVLLAASYGHLNRSDDALKAWNEAMKINPTYSLAQKAKDLPFKDPKDWQQVVDGLRKVGVTDEDGEGKRFQ